VDRRGERGREVNEKLAEMGQIARKVVERQIDAVLTRNGVGYSCPMRAELESEVVLIGDRDPVVRICNNGRILTLDSRVDELRNDPRFSSFFPDSPKLRVKRNDQEELRENFDAILRRSNS
jgi:hypothetical protein